MNMQIMDDEHVSDDMCIFDPDTIEDPPEDATLEDYALAEDDIINYVQ